jgi:hypothetical protein
MGFNVKTRGMIGRLSGLLYPTVEGRDYYG